MSLILNYDLYSGDITNAVKVSEYPCAIDTEINMTVLFTELNSSDSTQTVYISIYNTDLEIYVLEGYGYTVTQKPNPGLTVHVLQISDIILPMETLSEILGDNLEIHVFVLSSDENDTEASVHTFMVDKHYVPNEEDITKIKAAVYDDNAVDADGIITLSNGVLKQITSTGRETVVE